MMPVMQNMDNSMYWQRVMTELQMLLSQHPLNQTRGLPVNGVWFYGSGPFDFPGKPVILTDDEQLLAAFPEHIKRLDFEQKPEDNAVVIINQYHESKLLAFAGHASVNWFWNNTAYATAGTRWWRRLFPG